MPISSDYADRSDSQLQSRYVADSGELGPLDDEFLPDREPDFAQSATLDAARARLSDECRRLQAHLTEIGSHLEESERMLSGQSERRAQAVAALRAIEQDLSQHSRQAIVKTYQEWAQAELAYVGTREVCEYLRVEADHDRRCLAALDFAQQAMADATFLREPLSSAPLQSSALPARLALSADFAESNELHAPHHTVTSAQLVDQEALLAAREYERHTIARNIDERVRFTLSDAVLQAEFCEAAFRSDPAHANQVVSELKNRLNEALREADMLIFELEPMMLSELGLAGTLQRYLQDLIQTRDAPLAVRITGKERRCHVAIERALFRAAREAVRNALHHGDASRIQVALSYLPDAVLLSIEDDGVGFDVDAVMAHARKGFHSGLGQLCIEVDLIGAQLGVKSAPGRGTRIDYVVNESQPVRD
jgi:signal transduction histidine kinase